MKKLMAAAAIAATLTSGCASLWPRGVYPAAPPAPPEPTATPAIKPNPDGGPPIFIPVTP